MPLDEASREKIGHPVQLTATKRQELKERISARLLDVDDHFEATAISFENKETR